MKNIMISIVLVALVISCNSEQPTQELDNSSPRLSPKCWCERAYWDFEYDLDDSDSNFCGYIPLVGNNVDEYDFVMSDCYAIGTSVDLDWPLGNEYCYNYGQGLGPMPIYDVTVIEFMFKFDDVYFGSHQADSASFLIYDYLAFPSWKGYMIGILPSHYDPPCCETSLGQLVFHMQHPDEGHGAGNVSVTSTDSLMPDRWYYLAVQYRFDVDTLEVYVDGDLWESFDIEGIVEPLGGYKLQVGKIDGLIDWARITQRVFGNCYLTADDFKERDEMYFSTGHCW